MKTFDEVLLIVNAELAKTNWNKEPGNLYAPIAYELSLGGKRIRPALTLMACNLYKEDVSEAIKPALGVEVFHNFTLLHDDIMDKADVRRGKPTVHIKWNENTAILSGDMMLIEAYKLIAQTPQNKLKNVLDVFSISAGEVCEGQQYDMEFESREHVSADEYIEMIRLKTAVLLGGALKIGALIGGANEADAQYLYDFGIGIGLAFQLKDDLLDVYGDEATFGKKIGGDILCNKKTYLLIHAIEKAKGEDAEELNTFFNNFSGKPEDKIAGITEIYNRLEVRKICEEAMDFYYDKALANLQKVSVFDDKKQELRLLAQKLMSRKD